MTKFTVIKDTREKVGSWDFSFANECETQVVQTLHTGDYTLKGWEEVICVERKRTTGEIALNLGAKWKVFEDELERMTTYAYRYIVCEFSIEDVLSFPVNSTIPKYRWQYLRMNGKYLMKKLNEIAEKYGIEILYCGDKISAEKAVLDIFKNVTTA